MSVSAAAEIKSDGRRKYVANHPSALKRVRSSEKKRLRNRRVRQFTRTSIKKARQAIEAGDIERAQELVRNAISALDRAVSKGVIHRNNAARRKSRLMAAFNKTQQQV